MLIVELFLSNILLAIFAFLIINVEVVAINISSWSHIYIFELLVYKNCNIGVVMQVAEDFLSNTCSAIFTFLIANIKIVATSILG